jgi:hypothetical protein
MQLGLGERPESTRQRRDLLNPLRWGHWQNKIPSPVRGGIVPADGHHAAFESAFARLKKDLEAENSKK